MKRLIVVVLTLALSVAIVSAAFAAKGTTTNVKSKVTVNYQTERHAPVRRGLELLRQGQGQERPVKGPQGVQEAPQGEGHA